MGKGGTKFVGDSVSARAKGMPSGGNRRKMMERWVPG